MTGDDLEPIDPEPGAALARLDPEWRFAQARSRRSAWILAAVVGAGLAVSVAIAITTRSGHHRPAPTTSAATPVNRLTSLVTELQMGLHGLGSGRYAAVIDGRLYILDGTQPAATLVPLPKGHAVIQDQSGSSLLLSTFEQTLVSTRPVRTRTLSPRETPIRAIAPKTWWLLRNDGTIRSDERGPTRRVPAGLRIVAVVREGFVALDAPDFRWVISSGSTIRKIAPSGYQLLTVGPRTVVFKHSCGYDGCAVEILGLAHGAIATSRLPVVLQFAALSPNGKLLALASTRGDVFILDAKTGGLVVQVQSVHTQNSSLPFTWTADSRALIVVGTHDVQVLRAGDGFATSIIAKTGGLEQLVALP